MRFFLIKIGVFFTSKNISPNWHSGIIPPYWSVFSKMLFILPKWLVSSKILRFFFKKFELFSRI